MQAVAFHLAFPVTNLEATKDFYGQVLGCDLGRESDKWVDFNFFGHQLSAHLCETMPIIPTNLVDGKAVPVSHLGAVLGWNDWEELALSLQKQQITFLIEPYIRFKGLVGEQGTFFVLDPSGNGVEFKSFKSESAIFAK